MRPEFVRLTREVGSPVFMVWDREACMFQEHNGNNRWESWEAFLTDLRVSLAEHGLSFGGRHHEEGDELLDIYQKAAPTYIKNVGKPSSPEPSKTRMRLSDYSVWALLAGFLALVLYTVWSQLLLPTMGRFGLVEYKSAAEERYEKFLSETRACRENKKVYSEKSGKFPALHTFNCADGTEKVWAYRLEKASKVSEGKWILE